MYNRRFYIFIFMNLFVFTTQANEISSLWVSGDPAASEQNFKNAVTTLTGDNRLILFTQIARTYVYRQNFSEARNILESIKKDLHSASTEAKVRYWLELGRTYASHQHPPKFQTSETKQRARSAYETARNLAKKERWMG